MKPAGKSPRSQSPLRKTAKIQLENHDLPAPHRNALSLPQIGPVSRGQMRELRLEGDSIVFGFICAVVAGESIAGLRGES
jgi:hypothetical protein